MVVGLQIEQLRDSVVLGERRIGQRHVRPLEEGTGVGQGLVQKQPEEVVAQIVVRPDVPAGAAPRVGVQGVDQAPGETADRGRAGFETVEGLPVPQHQPDDTGEIIGGPPTLRVGFAGTHRAAEGHGFVKPGVMHLDRQWLRRRVSGGEHPVRLPNLEVPVSQPGQPAGGAPPSER
ncbi:MAG: hypothetical protein R2882_01895 [Gemmatimonadales bacterium]